MKKELKIASTINIIANIFLFIIKITIGLISGAISILSDAINSLGDIVVAIIIYFTIKINNKDADDMHPFGHTRAENIAGYTTGLFMILLGFTITNISIKNLLNKISIEYNSIMLLAIAITLVVKLSLFLYMKKVIKTNNSPSLKANMQDHLNDIIIILGVFVAVFGLKIGIWWLDPVIGMIIAIYVIKEGWEIIIDNINHLMGKKASDEIIEEIKKRAMSIKDVKGLNDILAQYLGNKVQVEIHIEVDKKLDVKRAHDIGKKVQKKIEAYEDINNCFVHIDIHEEKDNNTKTRKIKKTI